MSDRPGPAEVQRVFLGEPPRHNRRALAAAAGVRPELAERLWRALGFATLADDAVAFTDADLDALRRVGAMLEAGLLDETTVLRMARALGRTTARLAQWQTEIMVGALLDPNERPGDADLARLVEAARLLLPDFERMLVHVWRAQLAASAGRLLALADDAPPHRLTLAVGFADLVSFTRVSRELDELALAELVEGFEERASDVVAQHGGRLVKTLGDEVLFTAADPEVAARMTLDLVDALGRGDPGVRIGLAYGPVLPVMGDVFGTTVNLAARLTAIARPGSVIADSALAEAVIGRPGIDVVKIRRRPARGLGVVQPYVLRRP
ncbi:adenylate/guanylate cyclase domain-containing protein [Acrocarpospora catenulata]|uniref:adenylate/guanylate cyclase domain-containing protein n=1 Tax=Acrocarpospora catenulata TaxID=2836182 RepID=UPI001BD952C0|nr:adenylate/guanylate cyclase domain-containing protein [Acrocarpospora catenulata]